MSVCFLNDEFLPLQEAKVSVLDRGFIFGEGVYEVIPVFARRPFRLTEHLARFARSMQAIGLDNPRDLASWGNLVRELVCRDAEPNLSVYLQVTRGAMPRNHAAPVHSVPTVFGMVSPLVSANQASVDVVSQEDIRWQRCDIKATALLANVMARTAAAAAGAYEAILFRDDLLTEGAASNVFAVLEGRILTPPCTPAILAGVTRNAFIEALSESDEAVCERDITREEITRVQELWLTSSTRDLVPVARLDGQLVGTGEHPVLARVMPRYAAFKAQSLASTPPIAFTP